MKFQRSIPVKKQLTKKYKKFVINLGENKTDFSNRVNDYITNLQQEFPNVIPTFNVIKDIRDNKIGLEIMLEEKTLIKLPTFDGIDK